ncbi:thermostable hemolysin [Pseudomonas alliivorans]|uniref:thermostable hemolysin n=1 Tax=Pseudomonas TaxID=286 RepID=UPI000C07898C|nr:MULTISPECIES: thermostable hemolysin [Pseudomonas]MBP0940261.1 thermostable hemolysin [Pseudomonas alliivorans]MBP0951096.1 thermostable hemolysin [Pseudomonas alliivorans]MCO5364396.1 thermostable hemolysin [Pseudomonas alliivorans]MCQ9468976.1 thermostable hemolysin [Pseudomonas alliivorans]MEE4305986.1 thermostable hemolysin [Pseudomonas alliivorans]
MLIRVTDCESPLWKQAVEIVKSKFQSSYKANIEPNPQYFALTQDEDERIMSCAGITFGDHRTLFSEQYLPRPIHEILSERHGQQIERASIAEIGSLISHHVTAGVIMVNMIPLLAWCMGAQYLLCTVTPRVREMMESCQIVFEPLLTADPTRLSEDGGKNWGSYYAKRPITGFIKVDPQRSRFAAMTLGTLFNHLPVQTRVTQ